MEDRAQKLFEKSQEWLIENGALTADGRAVPPFNVEVGEVLFRLLVASNGQKESAYKTMVNEFQMLRMELADFRKEIVEFTELVLTAPSK